MSSAARSRARGSGGAITRCEAGGGRGRVLAGECPLARAPPPDPQTHGPDAVLAVLFHDLAADVYRVTHQVIAPHLEPEPLDESCRARPVGEEAAQGGAGEGRVHEDIRVAPAAREVPIVVDRVEVLGSRDLLHHPRHRQLQGEARQRLPLFHLFPAALAHRITSSARISTDWGSVRPRALAVVRLMTSWYRVGCSTGKSAGFAPFRILSTYVAERRIMSVRFGP